MITDGYVKENLQPFFFKLLKYPFKSYTLFYLAVVIPEISCTC